MQITTVDQGVHALLKRGFDNPCGTTCNAITMKRSRGGSHYLVWIDDNGGAVTFNGMDYSQFLKEMEV